MTNDFVYLALGSNLGDKKKNFETAITKLEEYGVDFVESSPLYRTPAILLKYSPSEWNIPYLNCVIKTKTNLNPDELLCVCKKVESELGRDFSKKWAPRPIDIDILIYKDEVVNKDNLTIPHKSIFERHFLLDELSFIYPEYLKNANIKQYAKEHQPVFMGILNVTPDSFSDGNINNKVENFTKNFEQFESENVSIIDIGAESTKPKAKKITFNEELERLSFVFDYIKNRKFSYFKPLLSIDTYHYETAVKAIENGFNIINDVNALKDERMLEILKGTNVKYVLTHSLTVPPVNYFNLDDHVTVDGMLGSFVEEKLNIFEKNNIKKEQIIFDVGIGFGKTPSQNFQLLQKIEEFKKYGIKIMVGHSRKSFFKMLQNNTDNFDIETIALTLGLAHNVDILRVHKPIENQNALLAFEHLNNQIVEW